MRTWSLPVVAVLVGMILAGCISEETNIPPSDDPATTLASFTLPETITGLEAVQQIEFVLEDGTVIDQFSANGIWLHDGLLYASGRPGLAIVDVSDPEAPVPLSVMESETQSRDVDIMEHPNGKLYAVLAGSPGIILVDVTDPREPFVVSSVEIGYHNIATVPGTAVVYNSRSLYSEPGLVTDGGLVDIVDFSDPTAPVINAWHFPRTVEVAGGLMKPVTAPACHDISVYPEADRAYCAGVTETQVWDISDVLEPKILQIVPSPTTNIHHAAYATWDHKLLVIGDELGGAAGPGCTVPDQAYGGVWFYDISDLANPTPLGWWAPENAQPGVIACTAHFGTFLEDRDILVMSFYRAGVAIIDFSDPTDPVEIDAYAPDGSAWEGRYYRGFIYTGDSMRGIDIVRPVGEGEVGYTT